MTDRESNSSAVAHNVELSVGRLDSLSVLPCVASQVIQKLALREFTPAALASVIESNPALAAMTFSLIARQNIHLSVASFALRPLIERLPAEVLVTSFLSMPVLHESTALPLDKDRSEHHKNLLLHSLAVACCAKRIAELTLGWTDPEFAYFGGLLHDVGKFAIEETMPKSLARMVEEATAESESLHRIEYRHLGTDHALLGKRLARKWRFPAPISNAIWLHHSEMAAVARSIPDSDTARVVQLADMISRQAGIGHSGSYDTISGVDQIAAVIGISTEQLEQLRANLPAQVAQKAALLDLDSSDAQAGYYDALRSAAGQFAARQSELSAENRVMKVASSHLDFAAEFLLGVDSTTSVMDIAQDFAKRWQRFYQTGNVCLYLAEQEPGQGIRTVVVEGFSQANVFCLETPEEGPVITPEIAGKFAMPTAHDHIDWLFEQLDTQFDAQRTRLAPLLSKGRTVGAIAFELNYPVPSEQFEEKFKLTAAIGGAVLDAVTARQNQEDLVERLVRSASVIKEKEAKPAQAPAPENPLDGLAELAGGAAHELNNPLAVISGRAQLLAEAEEDPEKKEILRQIHENAGQASAIIEDLMSFAEPPKPRAALTAVTQIIDEALQLAGRKVNMAGADIQARQADNVAGVFVDSAQIVSALANIIANAVESYGGKPGPVIISAELDEARQSVRLQIIDSGCGMKSEVLRKATQPFFSAKPAGRKRGMGLSYAQRFIQINNGSLTIESEPGQGTTVTILLPLKSQ